jgi:hypothetical protein
MRFRRHAIALLLFAAIVGLWLLPLFRQFSTALPGTNAGDNLTFVWNVWWMRYALHHPGVSFLTTPFLFYPFGGDLTLHTHTALPALIAALAGPTSLIASQNALIVVHLSLNFACSYALGFRMTRTALPAFAGALVFGTSSFVSAHLLGHFNLIAAWIVPLVCLLAWQAAASSSLTRGVLAGVALAAAAYIDYYLFIYSVVLLALSVISRSTAVATGPAVRSRLRRRALTSVFVLLAIDAVVIAIIIAWPGERIDIGPVRISIRRISNPLTAAWILAGAACALAIVPRVQLGLRREWLRRNRRVLFAAATTALLFLIPLMLRGATLWKEGRYVSQPYQWRSAPGGIDVATLLLGNPFHAVWGERARRAYAGLGIDLVEGSGWLPVAAVLLATVAVIRRRDAVVGQWTLVAAVFMTWALGPWLVAFGRQTPFMLPTLAIRYVPVVANVRIPGRAMIVVSLGVAMLAAIGMAWLMISGRRGRTAAWGLVILLAIECVPAPPPLYVPDIPSQYAALKNARPGAVCELPLGIRDGFGETGHFDSRVLLYQTVHERPIVGGFLARLPPTISRDYAALPVIGSFLRLSSGGTLAAEPTPLPPHDATSALASAGIALVVLDTRTASPDLIRYVQSSLALHVIAEEDGRLFYEVGVDR